MAGWLVAKHQLTRSLLKHNAQWSVNHKVPGTLKSDDRSLSNATMLWYCNLV